MKNNLQMVIVVGMIILMAMAIIIDGEMGERVFATVFGGFSLVLGYFYRKAGEVPN